MLITITLTVFSCSGLASQEAALQQVIQRELRIYPIQAPAKGDFPIGIRRLEDKDPTGRDSDTRVRLNFNFDYGIEAIKDYAALATHFCEPTVDPREERIQADREGSGLILAYLQPAQHDWLARFLELQMSPDRGWAAELKTQIYAMPPGTLAKMNLQGSATLLVDETAIRTMLESLNARSAELVAAPDLTLRPNQMGEVSALNEVAYIKAFELKIIEPGAVEIADPIVDVMKEGSVIGARLLQVADGLYGLQVECVTSEIERPIPTKKVKLSPVHPTEVEIGLPQLRSAKVSATVRLADGAGVLLIASGLAKDRDLAMLITFRRIASPPNSEGKGNF